MDASVEFTALAAENDMCETVLAFLNEQTEAVAEYSEPLVRRLIEKITVYDEKLGVEIKSGLTVEIEALTDYGNARGTLLRAAGSILYTRIGKTTRNCRCALRYVWKMIY